MHQNLNVEWRIQVFHFHHSSLVPVILPILSELLSVIVAIQYNGKQPFFTDNYNQMHFSTGVPIFTFTIGRARECVGDSSTSAAQCQCYSSLVHTVCIMWANIIIIWTLSVKLSYQS